VIGGLDRLDRRLGDHRSLVRGDTDSERFFALITKEAEAAAGDVTAGIARAARWIAEVRSGDMATIPAVIVASERMDEDPGWRAITPGHLVHVGPDLQVRSDAVLDDPPRRPLTLSDLDRRAAASQRAAPVGH
jgi:glutamine amidotransferase